MSDYVATAKVRVRPDLRGFRAELREAVVRSSSGIGVKIPVLVDTQGVGTAQKVRKQVADEQIAVQRETAKATRETIAVDKESERSAQRRADVENQIANANKNRVRAQREVLGAASALDAAQIRLTRSTAAVGAAERALQKALLLGDATTIKYARNTLQLAVAQQTQATAALNAERSNRRLSTRLEFASRGAVAQSATFLGLRGATLAANSAFIVGTAAVVAFGKALSDTAQLQTNLNVFGVTAGATADQMERADEVAKQLGRDITLPGVGASDAASTFSQLARAGLSVQDSLDGARGVLQLATAAEIDNARATELVASALNSFGLSGDQAVRVADLLTGSANESQGSIDDMGVALQQASASARQVGVGLEDTVALLTLLARNGLKGSDAGTSLRTAFLRLVRPTKVASDILADLNVQVRDVDGNVRPEVFADLATALESLSRKQRDAALATIFGADAFRAAAILGRESTLGLNAIRDATQQQGLAAELAGARTKGLAGQIEALKNSLQTLGIQFGEAVIGPAGALVDTLNEVVSAGGDAISVLDRLGKAIPGTPGGDGGGGGIFDSLFFTGGDAIREVRALVESARKQGGDIRVGELPTEAVERFNRELIASLDTSRELVSVFDRTKGPSDAVDVVRRLSEQLVGSAANAQGMRERLEAVERLIVSLGRAPTEIELEVFLKEGFIDEESLSREIRLRFLKAGEEGKEFLLRGLRNDLSLVSIEPKLRAEINKMFNQLGSDGANFMLKSFSDTLGPQLTEALGNTPFIAGLKFGADFRSGVRKTGRITPEDLGITPAQLEAQTAGFEARGVRAQLAGDEQGRLSELRAEQERIRGQLESAIEGGRKFQRVRLERRLLEVQQEEQRILDGIAAEQKQLADEADRKREEAHQDRLRLFNRRVAQQENRILIAAGTAFLADDLRTTRALVAILDGIIKSDKLRTDELIEFKRRREQAVQAVKQVQEAIAARRREERERILESLQLDVELAQTNENISGEIRGRQKVIRQLKKLQDLEKKGSTEWKRLRNQIASERAAIRDLKKEQQGKVGDLSSLAFEFLREQQGFAANLLGNLIPLGAQVGTVGNVSLGAASSDRVFTGFEDPTRGLGPDSDLRAESQKAAGRGAGGPSRGQQETLITLTRAVLRVLRTIERGQGFPESNQQKKTASASMDYGI